MLLGNQLQVWELAVVVAILSSLLLEEEEGYPGRLSLQLLVPE
jgi:hypothetical protein